MWPFEQEVDERWLEDSEDVLLASIVRDWNIWSKELPCAQYLTTSASITGKRQPRWLENLAELMPTGRGIRTIDSNGVNQFWKMVQIYLPVVDDEYIANFEPFLGTLSSPTSSSLSSDPALMIPRLALQDYKTKWVQQDVVRLCQEPCCIATRKEKQGRQMGPVDASDVFQFVSSLHTTASASKKDDFLTHLTSFQQSLQQIEDRMEQTHLKLIQAARDTFNSVEKQQALDAQDNLETEMKYVALMVAKDAREQSEECKKLNTTSRQTFCHQCQSKNDLVACRVCPRSYCASCLRKVYGVRNILSEQRKCAHCRNNCFCELGIQHENISKLNSVWEKKTKIEPPVVTEICSICRSEPPVRFNPWFHKQLRMDSTKQHKVSMIQCRQCSVAVHESCVTQPCRIAKDSTWRCDVCSIFGTHVGQTVLNLAVPEKLDQRSLFWIDCTLCPVKQTFTCLEELPAKWRKIFVRTADDLPQYAHSICLKWLEAAGDDRVLTHSECKICHESSGAVMPCSFATCTCYVHVTCAFQNGFKVQLAETDSNSPQYPVLLCPEHFPVANDLRSFRRLKEIRYNLERVRMLATMVNTRERLKRRLAQIDWEIFQEQIQRLPFEPLMTPNVASKAPPQATPLRSKRKRNSSQTSLRSYIVPYEHSSNPAHLPLSMRNKKK